EVSGLRVLRRIPFAFLTRKATVENVITALRGKAVAVVKKPDPKDPGPNIERAYDAAMAAESRLLASQIRSAISKASWWRKHREAVVFFVLGLVSGVLANLLYAIATRTLSKGSS